MQPLPDTAQQNAVPNNPSEPLAHATATVAASTTSEFRPYKPPLQERQLTQTAIWVVLFLIAGIGLAAVTVWMFLPSMLPKLPLTFL